MTSTITSVAADANTLFGALTAGLDITLDLPVLTFDTDFVIPDETGLPTVTPLTMADLTSATVDGTGVFDVLMKATRAHLEQEHKAGRITGGDYAKVVLGSITAVMQFGVQFLLGKDRAQIENLQLIEAVKLTQAQVVKAQAEVQLVRAQIQNAQLQNATLKLQGYTARNQYASSKMDLVVGFNGVLKAENEQKLVDANYLIAWANTHNNLPDGAAVGGIVGTERAMKDAQKLLYGEQYELARAQVRDTLSTGGAFGGIVATDKLIKLSQLDLTAEQVDTARAATKDTMKSGAAISGIMAQEKLFKQAQQKLVNEQYETQRGQTRGTLSTGETILGLVGAQTSLYKEQVTSYKRDAEHKAFKAVLDSWIARKTIDDGVEVPALIDIASIQAKGTAYFTNLGI